MNSASFSTKSFSLKHRVLTEELQQELNRTGEELERTQAALKLPGIFDCIGLSRCVSEKLETIHRICGSELFYNKLAVSTANLL